LLEVYADGVEEAIATWQEVRGEEAAWGQYRAFANRSLRYWVEQSLGDAINRKIGVGWYARGDGRTGYRNGYYERLLVTPYGSITVRVPRLREGSYEHSLFKRQELFTKEVGTLLMDVFLAGVSTRRVGETLEKVLGYKVSAGTVSEVCKGLDTLVRQFWRRQIGDRWRYLLLDAVVIKNRSAIGTEKRFVLCALGISVEGKKEILAFKQVESESEVAWETFLLDLVSRGFLGEKLELVTTDGNPGVIAALDSVWPYTPRGRCWVHKMRNVAGKLRKKNETECMNGIKLAYLAGSRREASQQIRKWIVRWEKEEPKAVKCLLEDLEALLTVFDIPEEHRVLMRTTNAIERVFREVRRRTRPMNCFANRRSIDRILYALLSRQNKLWTEARPLPNFTHSA